VGTKGVPTLADSFGARTELALSIQIVQTVGTRLIPGSTRVPPDSKGGLRCANPPYHAGLETPGYPIMLH